MYVVKYRSLILVPPKVYTLPMDVGKIGFHDRITSKFKMELVEQ
jgi:hypothetical protein